MKVNKNKRHFIVSNNEHVSIKIDDVQVESNKNHLDGIIKEASPELNYLSGIAPYKNQGSFIFQMEWAPFKSLFWNTND